jgi:Tol biopolymer transport system component/DNA-binding winged helix-turn-helix (wHTH) protein
MQYPEMNSNKEQTYRFGDYQLAAAERVLRRNGEIVPLPLKSLEVLLALVAQHGRVVSKEELMEQVWPDSHVEEANLARHIYTLRRTLGESSKEAGGEHHYILTIPGRGYRFVMDVQADSFTASEGDEQLNLGKDEVLAQPRWAGMGLGYRMLIALVALSAIVLLVVLIIVRRARTIESPPEPNIIRLANSGDLRDGVISPDGKYIAKIVKNQDQHSLLVQLFPNGNETQIVPPTSDGLGCLAFSPDSSLVYYTTKRKDQAETLYQIPVTGGNVRRITESINSPISFAPDGRRFAFVREDHALGRSSLLIASLDGTEEKELCSRKTPEYLDYPAWSPDGNRIICIFNTTSRSLLLEINLKERTEQLLYTPPWKFIRRPVWLKDGSGLLFSVEERFNVRHTWHLPYPDTRSPRRLMTGVQMWRGPSITDDARELVYIERSHIASVWVGAAAAPESYTRITAGGGNYEGLTWTPDGRLLYSSDTNGYWNIFLMNADGKGKQQLTYDTYDNTMPWISPDGRYIFFTSNRKGVADIWRIDKDGSNPKQMTFGTDGLAPQCTTDGKWVVFTAPNSKSAFALHKVPVEGGAAETLGIENAEEVVISPNGKFLACLMPEGLSSASVMPTNLTVISLVGGNIRRLGKVNPRPADGGGAKLRWMPDSSGIVYIDSPDGNNNLWVQPLAGGQPRRLTSYSDDGIFDFNFSRDGRLAVLRGPVIYRIVRITNPIIAPAMR